MSEVNFKEILNYLSRKDEHLSKIILLTQPIFQKKPHVDDFSSLVKIIIGQQLSGAAANTIISRVEGKFASKKLDPNIIGATDSEILRKCGMSNAKIKYVKEIAQLICRQTNFFQKIRKLNDLELIETLCELRGVGVWTASIFAMGQFNRKNIFAYGDVSLNKAIKVIYGKDKNVEDVIENWSPYKTVACRILWQWIDNGMPNGN